MKLLLFILLQFFNPLEHLQKLVDSVQNELIIRNGVVAESNSSTQSSEYKLQYNTNKLVNSASVLKFVSTASALSVLGTNYCFQTFLEYDGVILDSVLQGNIYVR
jgi:D-alanyl-D-alanine carboxypeptidase/D-alanyl-D-alanine-endopeptidase (penicillin-binding protein 4)